MLRNGKLVADLTPPRPTEERLIREMVGGEIGARSRSARGPDAPGRCCS